MLQVKCGGCGQIFSAPGVIPPGVTIPCPFCRKHNQVSGPPRAPLSPPAFPAPLGGYAHVPHHGSTLPHPYVPHGLPHPHVAAAARPRKPDCIERCVNNLRDGLLNNPIGITFGISVLSICIFPPLTPFLCCASCVCCCVGKRTARSWMRNMFLPPPAAPRLMLDQESEHPRAEAEADDVGSEDEAADVPSYWVNSIETRDFDDRVDESERVIGQIQKLFDVTWKSIVTRDRSGPTPVGLKVLNVNRVEDRRMWSAYVKAGNGIRRKRGPSCARIAGVKTGEINIQQKTSGNDLDVATNEFFLFHGTSPEGALCISEDGFRLDLTGSNAGNMFGPGAYFAECCSKGDEYAKEGSGIYRGIYAMLLCRVTCGEMFRMLKRDDAKMTEAMRSGNYDSVLGDREASVSTYREFVVYRQRQIYPEYVVLYKRVLPDASSSSSSDSES